MKLVRKKCNKLSTPFWEFHEGGTAGGTLQTSWLLSTPFWEFLGLDILPKGATRKMSETFYSLLGVSKQLQLKLWSTEEVV